MFNNATAFNQPLNNWDISGVTSLALQSMFNGASSFNGDISNWNTSNISSFFGMFNGASAFNQNLSAWDITALTTVPNSGFQFLRTATLSTVNYDAILISWAAQTPITNGILFDFGNSQYTLGGAAESARNTLINTYGWTITDGGGI